MADTQSQIGALMSKYQCQRRTIYDNTQCLFLMLMRMEVVYVYAIRKFEHHVILSSLQRMALKLKLLKKDEQNCSSAWAQNAIFDLV